MSDHTENTNVVEGEVVIDDLSTSSQGIEDSLAAAVNEATREVSEVEALTADLQRVQAEFINYKRRVEGLIALEQEKGVAKVLRELLNILDDLDRAESHGELQGGFKAVAEQLQATASKFGLTKFDENQVPFDFHIHEAMMHSTSSEVTEQTVVKVFQPGYRFKESVLRHARVEVADPEN